MKSIKKLLGLDTSESIQAQELLEIDEEKMAQSIEPDPTFPLLTKSIAEVQRQIDHYEKKHSCRDKTIYTFMTLGLMTSISGLIWSAVSNPNLDEANPPIICFGSGLLTTLLSMLCLHKIGPIYQPTPDDVVAETAERYGVSLDIHWDCHQLKAKFENIQRKIFNHSIRMENDIKANFSNNTNEVVFGWAHQADKTESEKEMKHQTFRP